MNGFEGWGSNKTHRLWICRSSMAMWVALSLLEVRVVDERRPTRDEEKVAIVSFPGPTNACRCRDCRYWRVRHPGRS